MKKLAVTVVALVVTLGLIIIVSGCDGECETKPSSTAPSSGCCGSRTAATEEGDDKADAVAPTDDAVAVAESAEIEQTVCPVMGGAINKEIYTDYEGRRIYFCCGACPKMFAANPDKYLAILDQGAPGADLALTH